MNTERFQILLVDDDTALITLMSMNLQAEGHQVATAQSADDALEKLQTGNFDIVLLDLGMPPHEHDITEGLRVLSWLEAHPRSVKVIVLTGQDADKSAYAVIKDGAFDFLSKPVEVEALNQAIRRAGLFLKNERQLRAQDQHHKVTLKVPLGQGVKPVRNIVEEQLLRQVLEETGFNIHETARKLNINRENVYYLLKKYNIKRTQ